MVLFKCPYPYPRPKSREEEKADTSICALKSEKLGSIVDR
jgi:hypothetical protein